jgi:hypothetical protein
MIVFKGPPFVSAIGFSIIGGGNHFTSEAHGLRMCDAISAQRNEHHDDH